VDYTVWGVLQERRYWLQGKDPDCGGAAATHITEEWERLNQQRSEAVA